MIFTIIVPTLKVRVGRFSRASYRLYLNSMNYEFDEGKRWYGSEFQIHDLRLPQYEQERYTAAKNGYTVVPAETMVIF